MILFYYTNTMMPVLLCVAAAQKRDVLQKRDVVYEACPGGRRRCIRPQYLCDGESNCELQLSTVMRTQRTAKPTVRIVRYLCRLLLRRPRLSLSEKSREQTCK